MPSARNIVHRRQPGAAKAVQPAARLAVHRPYGSVAATALLVSCASYWYLLFPPVALHGITIVTMFYYWFLPAMLAQLFLRAPDRRAYRVQPRPRESDQYAHDLDWVPDTIAYVERALSHGASLVPRHPVLSIAGAASGDTPKLAQIAPSHAAANRTVIGSL
jgi:hypothetical protein